MWPKPTLSLWLIAVSSKQKNTSINDIWTLERFLAPSQYKDGPSRYGDFRYKDKTVSRPSYLYNGNPYASKTTSLFWDGPLVASNGNTMPDPKLKCLLCTGSMAGNVWTSQISVCGPFPTSSSWGPRCSSTSSWSKRTSTSVGTEVSIRDSRAPCRNTVALQGHERHDVSNLPIIQLNIQHLVQVNNIKISELRITDPWWGKSTGGRWISTITGQQCGNRVANIHSGIKGPCHNNLVSQNLANTGSGNGLAPSHQLNHCWLTDFN